MTTQVLFPSDLPLFLEAYNRQEKVCIPIYSDSRAFPGSNSLCLAWFFMLADRKAYILPFNHPDALSVAATLPSNAPLTWVPNKKELLHLVDWNIADIESLEYLTTSAVTPFDKFYSSIIRNYHEKFYNYTNVNRAIPLTKWIEYCETYGEHLVALVDKNRSLLADESYLFLNKVAITTLYEIEKAGIKINPIVFEKHFPIRSKRYVQNDIVHSQYNLYTTTGRPSNKFGGVNYAALNSTDGSRASFISRFGPEKGILVSFDYEAYHLRLIAKLIDYTLPTTSVHEYLGQQYFKKSILTPEEYEQSKQITFTALYGETDHPITFFKAVKQYREKLWQDITQNGYILSPLYHRKVELKHIWEPNPSKVFNYLIQITETETSLASLYSLTQRYRDVHSKLILYTYDSILIDFCYDDPIQLLIDTKKILEHENKEFPTRMYTGYNYQDMKERGRKTTT